MAEAANNPEQVAAEALCQGDTLAERFMEWVRTEAIWYAGSFTFHLLLLSSLLLLGNVAARAIQGEGPGFRPAENLEKPEKDLAPPKKFEIGDASEEPTELNTPMLTVESPAIQAQEEEYNDDSTVFEHRGGGTPNASHDPSLGGLGSFNMVAYGGGARLSGSGGVGPGRGTGTDPGSGGNGVGFGGIGRGNHRARLGQDGGIPAGERAVAAALHWLYRHQLSDGSWSLDHKQRCIDQTCTGPGAAKADAGATALGLLCFLAAGQTHKTNGPYRVCIQNALIWLLRHQERDGNLAKGCVQPMYSHGLATIALCEAYGLSGDHNIGAAAQGAVNYILAAQNKQDFGWRYNPGDPGDTSVVGWQVMALKSALMAGLNVGGSSSADLACKWFDLVKCGPNGCNFQYQASTGPTPAMSAVGLLCRQYMGAKRNDPMMLDGVQYLMKNMPDVRIHNVYYWYYATQVMHNYFGYEWDTWNRAMRKVLISTQCRNKNSCANGSWDPDNPSKDAWGAPAGRHYVTTLSCLTLEVYYRYLPLYKLDVEGVGGGAPPAPAEKKAEDR